MVFVTGPAKIDQVGTYICLSFTTLLHHLPSMTNIIANILQLTEHEYRTQDI